MSTFITAIEIGSSKIMGAVGIVEDDRTLNIVAIEEQPLSPGSVRYGCAVNVEDVSTRINLIKKLLENNARVYPRKITGAYVALGGRSLASHPAEAARSFPVETEITDSVVLELKKKVRAEKATTKEVLDSVPVSYVVDGKSISVPVGTLGLQIRARYNLVVCDEKNRKNIRIAFQKSGLNIHGGIARILAVDSLILSKDQRNLGCVIIDFGAETTTVAVYKNNALRHLATIPMGSRLITKDLAKVLNISEERAEELKSNHVNLAQKFDDEDRMALEKTLDNIDYATIHNIVQARASEIVANIAYQIEQSKLSPEELTEGIVLIGRGSRLGGFRELLQRQLNMRIARPSANENIHYAYNLNVPIGEALDVIAIMAAAAKSPRISDCTVMPKIEEPTFVSEDSNKQTEPETPSREELEAIEREKRKQRELAQKERRREEKERRRKEKEEKAAQKPKNRWFNDIINILSTDNEEFDSDDNDE